MVGCRLLQVLQEGIDVHEYGNSDEESMWLTLTACYAMDGQTPKGIATVERALRALPRSAKLLVNKGSMLANLCRIEEARVTYQVHFQDTKFSHLNPNGGITNN